MSLARRSWLVASSETRDVRSARRASWSVASSSTEPVSSVLRSLLVVGELLLPGRERRDRLRDLGAHLLVLRVERGDGLGDVRAQRLLRRGQLPVVAGECCHVRRQHLLLLADPLLAGCELTDGGRHLLAQGRPVGLERIDPRRERLVQRAVDFVRLAGESVDPRGQGLERLGKRRDLSCRVGRDPGGLDDRDRPPLSQLEPDRLHAPVEGRQPLVERGGELLACRQASGALTDDAGDRLDAVTQRVDGAGQSLRLVVRGRVRGDVLVQPSDLPLERRQRGLRLGGPSLERSLEAGDLLGDARLLAAGRDQLACGLAHGAGEVVDAIAERVDPAAEALVRRCDGTHRCGSHPSGQCSDLPADVGERLVDPDPLLGERAANGRETALPRCELSRVLGDHVGQGPDTVGEHAELLGLHLATRGGRRGRRAAAEICELVLDTAEGLADGCDLVGAVALRPGELALDGSDRARRLAHDRGELVDPSCERVDVAPEGRHGSVVVAAPRQHGRRGPGALGRGVSRRRLPQDRPVQRRTTPGGQRRGVGCPRAWFLIAQPTCVPRRSFEGFFCLASGVDVDEATPGARRASSRLPGSAAARVRSRPWAVSSAGRAPRLHRGGRRFEPVTAHLSRRSRIRRSGSSIATIPEARRRCRRGVCCG